ncbi:hypothetical protein HDV00_005032 [Rhizophlyctis rosea]|nr:hypothetical protein HDV00_005032 [Rhizophlyctis rosea]
MLRSLFQSNYYAPVKPLLSKEEARALDLGRGSGIWVMEMATESPLCHFTGLNISPVQPSTIKPKNVEIMEGVLTKLPLRCPDAAFDLVNMRLLVLGLYKDAWLGLIREIARVVKPGGYVELMEASSPAIPDPT